MGPKFRKTERTCWEAVSNAGPESWQELERARQLHQELQSAAEDHGPSDWNNQALILQVPPRPDQDRYNRNVRGHRGHIGQQETAVAIQYAQTPRTQNQKPGSREKNANQTNGKGALLAFETRSNQIDEQRRSRDAPQHQQRASQAQDSENSGG